MNRKFLSDILSGDTGDDINNLWNSTEADDEFGPIPSGKYLCHFVAGELTNSAKKGPPGYEMTFKVIDGKHTGRKLWHDLWMTPAAMSMDLSYWPLGNLMQPDQVMFKPPQADLGVDS